MPEIKSPKNPRMRLAKRLHIIYCSPSRVESSFSLTISLTALPALQQIIHDFRFRWLANFAQVNLNAKAGIANKRAFREPYRHVRVCGTKPVIKGLFLYVIGQQESEEGFGGFLLVF